MEVCATMKAQDGVSFLIDPLPVRPGTSAALTARTIDATIHPPLVRAQEKAAEIIPRLAEPLGSPLFFAMLAGTLVLGWLAWRGKFRPVGLLLPAALMMMLTSFRPVGSEGDVHRADAPAAVEEPLPTPEQIDNRRWRPAPLPGPPSYYFEERETRRPLPRAARRHDDRDERSLAEQLIASFPEVAIVAQMNAQALAHHAEMLARDERELRRYVQELRRRLRSEARRIARDR
jgi:hypothetical protein